MIQTNVGHGGEIITADLIPAISRFLGIGTEVVNTQRRELLLGSVGEISAGCLSKTYAGTTTAATRCISEYAECPTIFTIATWHWWTWSFVLTS